MIFRQLFDPASSTYTYLLADSGRALLIDTVFEQARRDLALLRELGLTLVATLDTHVHADHVTAAWLLKQRCGSQILLSQDSGATEADRSLRYHGLDLLAGTVRDNLAAGVVEPAMSKIKSLRFATEAAITILRIDDRITVNPEPRQ